MANESSHYKNLKKDVRDLADEHKALQAMRFFKTGKGEYGEGDKFLGISVPEIRKVFKKYYNTLELKEIKELLLSPYNEERLLALMILVEQFGKLRETHEVYDFYVKHMDRVNNWNLVDLSARPIVGVYLMDKDRTILDQWARSDNLWVRRIAIVATWNFIKNGQFDDTLRIARMLMNDQQDLIHKAVGWMLRELGKQDEEVLKLFLKKHQTIMPRTTLRYAIERLEASEKARFMKGTY